MTEKLTGRDARDAKRFDLIKKGFEFSEEKALADYVYLVNYIFSSRLRQGIDDSFLVSHVIHEVVNTHRWSIDIQSDAVWFNCEDGGYWEERSDKGWKDAFFKTLIAVYKEWGPLAFSTDDSMEFETEFINMGINSLRRLENFEPAGEWGTELFRYHSDIWRKDGSQWAGEVLFIQRIQDLYYIVISEATTDKDFIEFDGVKFTIKDGELRTSGYKNILESWKDAMKVLDYDVGRAEIEDDT